MINRTTGATLTTSEQIKQAIVDILTTPIGTRLMRRDYGSRLINYLSFPQNDKTKLAIISETATALQKWESRITVSSVSVDFTARGKFTITVKYTENDTDTVQTTGVSI